MYVKHPTFIQPKDEEIKVWRYMDFTKLISLLESRMLFFTRADNFEDQFEGSWPKINVENRNIVNAENTPPKYKKYVENRLQNMSEWFKQWPRHIAINCWHMNEQESVAMWKLYLKSDEGVALQSTYSKLKKSFIGEEDILIGTVNYLDYETESIDAGNILGPFVHKRKSFAHEQEVRALLLRWPRDLSMAESDIEHGVQIEIDIKLLIENVYVAPSAPFWFTELVEAVIKKYGYNFNVVHSKLNKNPTF